MKKQTQKQIDREWRNAQICNEFNEDSGSKTVRYAELSKKFKLSETSIRDIVKKGATE